MYKAFWITLVGVFLLGNTTFAYQQDDHSDHAGDKQEHVSTDEHQSDNGKAHEAGEHHEAEFDPAATAFHHIADANVYSIGPLQIPLPAMLYSKQNGWDFFMSSKFDIDSHGHGDGESAYRGYVLQEGSIKRVQDESFPQDKVAIDGFSHKGGHNYVSYAGKMYELDNQSAADGGLFGGGITSFYDFSLSKNVVSMLLMFLLSLFIFLGIAKAYKTRKGQAPKGLQSFFEPIFVFMRDEVVKPFLGDKWERYFPFLMSLFFFILFLNLFGQIPFFGGSNVTGNLAVTMVLALCTFLVVNISGNKHYWKHITWMPGAPAWLKIPILTPVELLGIFIKPITLMLRLFANITAGHMVMVIFVGLIFVFGKSGQNPAAAFGTSVGAGLLAIFMMAIELLVAFIQAFVFTILTASYIGAAVEEEHH